MSSQKVGSFLTAHPESPVGLKDLIDNRMECKLAYVYILTNKNDRVLYTGSTDNLKRRINVHKKAYRDGFTNKYNVNKLVYYGVFTDIISARFRERQIKGWVREKKIKLIESMNPKWEDLYKTC